MVIAVCFCGTKSAIQAFSPPEAGKTMKNNAVLRSVSSWKQHRNRGKCNKDNEVGK